MIFSRVLWGLRPCTGSSRLLLADRGSPPFECSGRERQRAFIELVTTTETLRMKIARLEEILEERDRELTRLRVARAS